MMAARTAMIARTTMMFRGSVYEVVEDEAKENLKEVLTPDEYKSIFDSGKYEIKLKILDIFR